MARSLYPSFSSAWKDWQFVLPVCATRAVLCGQGLNDTRMVQGGRSDLPRGARDDLFGTQDFFLDIELVVVAGVLVVASAAAGEVLAAWLDAMRGGADDRVYVRACKPRLLLSEGALNFLRCQNKWDEHGLAA